ncbi:MAG TPA: PQQ-binding-like beta-propeller repeat protein [Pyrinomonadaceae bacterium]|nr:PQQ-binding-like beta-propeller repeat protein [Pyrinomonadaceae bacterium]
MRDGVVTAFAEPRAWPEQLKLKWKVKVGTGHSSPVVSGRRVYLHSRDGEQEVVRAVDLATGKQLWQDSYAVTYTVQRAAAAHGKGPRATPAIANGKLYTFGITGILSSYDIKSGKLRWRKETSSQFNNAFHDYGVSSSPLVDRGLVMVNARGDSGALIAYNAETGEEKWSWKAESVSYASPIVADLGGSRQIITVSQHSISGVAADNGALLWQIPYAASGPVTIPTPVLYQQTLICSGHGRGTTAFTITKRGNEWTTEQIWYTPEVSMWMNTPVVSGDFLFGLSQKNRGQFFCLDARTGKVLWVSEGRAGDYAVIVKIDDNLLVQTTDSNLTVAKISGKGYEPLRRYQVADSETWAHPAVVKNMIVVKDVEHLALWSLS